MKFATQTKLLIDALSILCTPLAQHAELASKGMQAGLVSDAVTNYQKIADMLAAPQK